MGKKGNSDNKGKLWVLKAFRKLDGMTFYQWRINGKRVTYGEYMKKRMTCIYYGHYVSRYSSFTEKGNIVEVEIFYKEK
jgi:hypothetical protein